jgi:hypothetical protein
MIERSLNRDVFSNIRVGRRLNFDYGSTCMAGSFLNFSCGSNTGLVNITIHEPEALIAILGGSLDRIAVGLISLYCPTLMRIAFTLTMCVGSLIPVLNLQRKYSSPLNNIPLITFHWSSFFTCSKCNKLEVTHMHRSKKYGMQQKITLLIRTHKTQFHTSPMTVNKISVWL